MSAYSVEQVSARMSLTGDVIVTEFGEYYPCQFERHAFISVYGNEWKAEICRYADSQMEAQWLAG